MCLKKRQTKSWKRTLNYVFWSKTHLIRISSNKKKKRILTEVKFDLWKTYFYIFYRYFHQLHHFIPTTSAGVWLSVTASELRTLKSQSSSWCSWSIIYDAVRDVAHLCMFLQVWEVRQIISPTLLSFLTSSNPHLHEALSCFSKPLATSGPPWRHLRRASESSIVPPQCRRAHPGMSPKHGRV